MNHAAGAKSALTQAEIERARRYLAETRDALTRSIQNLSDAQWKFKPSAECWSIGEIVEHVVIVENRVANRIFSEMPNAPAPPADRNVQELDEIAIQQGADRSTKFQAPVAIHPSGTWTQQEALDRFFTSRAGIEALLQSTEVDHRRHAVPHPVMGPLDGYQWILLVAAHSTRHTNQIEELKNSPNFPG